MILQQGLKQKLLCAVILRSSCFGRRGEHMQGWYISCAFSGQYRRRGGFKRGDGHLSRRKARANRILLRSQAFVADNDACL